MSDKTDDNDADPVVSLPAWARGLVAVVLLGIAVAHLVWPDVAIDAVFLGLIAFAGLVWFFDFRSIEWLGIRAERRRIGRVRRALMHGAPVEAPAKAPEPPKLRTRPPSPGQAEATVTYHTAPLDLMPPTDPLDRLLWGAEQIRIELIVLLGSGGALRRVAPWSDYLIPELASLAVAARLLTKEQAEAVSTVLQMRNRAVHSQLLDPASDLAMEVVETLRSIPRTYVRIRRGHISLFRDRSLTTPYGETHGVMLVQVEENGALGHTGVYPRSAMNYTDGRFVTWLWDMDRAFRDEAWYSDPTTNEPKMAWSESATFIGQELPQQWGLGYRLPRPELGLIE